MKRRLAPVAVAALAVFGASPAAAECLIALVGEAVFQDRTLPQNGQLRLFGDVSAVSPGVLTDATGAQHLYTLDFDNFSALLVPDEPLPPGDYELRTADGSVSFAVSAGVDDVAPTAPAVDVAYDPQPDPIPLPYPLRFSGACAPSIRDFVLTVAGDDGDLLLVNDRPFAFVRDGQAVATISAGTWQVQLLDLAGNIGNSTTVEVEVPSGCSHAGSASSLGGLLSLLGLLGARRRMPAVREQS